MYVGTFVCVCMYEVAQTHYSHSFPPTYILSVAHSRALSSPHHPTYLPTYLQYATDSPRYDDDIWIARLRCPRWLSVLLAIVIVWGVFVVFGMIVYRSVQAIQDDWKTYEMGAEQVGR